ncbi:MarR family winged helix-turn-helix transcriptional regulator [Fodinibius halophilus]|uniref:MarR family transcriptional regulator n=1 Tax=Fodinibius halophilus TaxID=1736908 RepID=A0A6M1T0K1_9BACT|nr:MarR family transcriptional regulator [Fodinibius halophilus]NGP87459.1 MarR family transcriptional regulator [Fodinibius halophilus]
MAENNDDILEGNLFFLAAAFSRKLTRQADEVFASVGLSSSHALLLLLVQNDPGIQPSKLAERLHLKPSTITRLVQKLERRELVERESKGRATSVVSTAKGGRVAQEVKDKWRSLNSLQSEQLGDRYVKVLSEMIDKALEAME